MKEKTSIWIIKKEINQLGCKNLNPIAVKLIILSFLICSGLNLFGQNDKRVDSILAVIQTQEKDSLKATSYKQLGNDHFYEFAYEKAFYYYAKADSICERNSKLKTSNLRASLYNYMGYAVRVTHGYEKAIAYYQKAIELYEKTGNNFGKQEVNVALSQIFTREKKYDKALKLLNESIAFHEKNGYTSQNSYSYAIICRGYLYVQMKQFNDAEKDYKTYYTMAFKSNNERFQLWALNYMGYFHKEKGDAEMANYYYKRGIELGKKQQDYETINTSYEDLIDLYKTNKNIDSLVSVYQKYINNRNILDSIAKDKAIYDLEMKYQTAEKEHEINLLTARQQLSEQQHKNERYFYLIAFILTIALLMILLLRYRNKQKMAKKMAELNTFKARFFANVSHEFRTPLTLIKSPLQQLKSMNNQALEKPLDLIDRSTNRMLELVNQLLALSKTEGKSIKILLKKGNVTSFLNALLEPFVYQAEQENIAFQVNIENSENNHYFDKDILTKITDNLLSNAFKYSDEGTPIIFSAKIASDKLLLQVQNTHSGLKERNLDNFFERFYQYDESSTGFGIGLALVKDLINSYEGKVDVRKNKNVILFNVEIPLHTSLKNALLITDETESDRQIVHTTSSENNKEFPLLLIADDNTDMRRVIKEVFNTNFKILEACNGQQALLLAQQNIPDIVISDVMMPKMDGYSLLENLKNDDLTATIPIIMLTAKASDAAQLEGIQKAADAYMIKPFNHQLLKAKVAQLMSNRKKLQAYYSKKLVLRPLEVSIPTIDEKFIKKIEAIIQQEFAHPDFNTNTFAEKMHLSRMQLHRKLKSLFGVSASEFIRNERLKEAARLLQKTGIPIAQIAYNTGFNEVSYFSKCFKKVYGLSPTAYRNQK